MRVQLGQRAEYGYVTVSVKEIIRVWGLRKESEIMTYMW